MERKMNGEERDGDGEEEKKEEEQVCMLKNEIR